MVVIRKKDADMTIPAALIGLENQNAVFTDVGVSKDFEEFLDNIGFQFLTAYPFKNLGKAQSEKMNQARKNMPLFADVSKDDFDDVLGEGSWRKYNFTDNKMQKQLQAFKKKLKGESVYHLITMLQTKEFLGKELMISDATLKRISAKETNLTMDELDNESKIQKVVGYEAGKGLHSSGRVKDVGSTKADKGIEFTPDKKASRTISLLGKFDKGQPIIDLGRNSQTFDMFMDNIDIEKKKIIIDTENYIKNVMSIHGFYDEENEEWQIDISDAPTGKRGGSGSKDWGEILDKIQNESDRISDEGFGDTETEIRSHYALYENHKENLKTMKNNQYLSDEAYKEQLQRVEDAYSALKEKNEELGDMFGTAESGAETGEGDIEEGEDATDMEVVEAEGDEVGKALMKAERLLKAKGQTKEIPRVSDRSVEYVTLQGEIDDEDKFKPGAMEFSNVKFELKDYTGKTQRLSSPRELWNSRKKELTTGDIREALLSGDEQNALKAIILDTITPSNGEITIGKTEITWNVPNWEDNEAGYEEFLLRLQRKGVDEESEYQSFKPEGMKIATMLKVYSEIIKNAPDLDVKKILQSYEDEQEMLQELGNFMWQIKTDIKDLDEGVEWMEESDNPEYTKRRDEYLETLDPESDKYVAPEIDMETGKEKPRSKNIPDFYTPESEKEVEDYLEKKKKLTEKLQQEHASNAKENEIVRELDKNILQQKIEEKLGPMPKKIKIKHQLSDVPTKVPPHKRVISTAKDWKRFTEKYDDNSKEGLEKLYDDLDFFHKATESWTVKIPKKKEISSKDTATIKLIGGAKEAIELNLFYRPKGEVALDFGLPELYEHMRRNKEHTNVMDGLNYNKGLMGGLTAIIEYDDYFKDIIEFGGGQVEEEDTLVQPQVNLLWLGKPADKDKSAIHRRQLLRTKHEVKSTRKKWRSSSKKKIHDKEKAEDVNALMKIKNNYNQLQRVIG